MLCQSMIAPLSSPPASFLPRVKCTQFGTQVPDAKAAQMYQWTLSARSTCSHMANGDVQLQLLHLSQIGTPVWRRQIIAPCVPVLLLLHSLQWSVKNGAKTQI